MAEKRSELNIVDRVDASNYNREMNDDTTSDEVLDLKSSDTDLDTAVDAEAPEEAEQIMGQIEETRSQMGETIDAIQDKLSFNNLSEQVSEHVTNAVETAKEAVYEATIGKAANMMKNLSNELSSNAVVQTARNNPLPFILIGVGAGLLAYKGYTGQLSTTHRRSLKDMDRRKSNTGQWEANERRSGVGETSLTDTAREKLSNVSDKVSTATSNTMSRVSGAVDTAYTGATDIANRVYDRAGELSNVAYDKYDQYIEENPLAVGAVALGLGAAIGFALPTTRYEGQMLGEARDQLMEKAQDTAAQLLDKTKQVVSDASRNATQQLGSATEH